MKKITIAIDGFSSTGKSTLAKALAKSLGYIYIDTGAMYRAVTLFAMRKGLISSKSFDEERLIELLDTFDVHFEYNVSKGYADIYLNDENVEELIRTLEVSRFVSQIAAVSAVRKKTSRTTANFR